MQKNSDRTQIISFLSGKGGAGKTSASIGISYLLNDMGFDVLLVDFDFVTNGASYFYKYLYNSVPGLKGLYEQMSQRGSIPLEEFGLLKLNKIKIKEGLYFAPSRVNFSQKLPLRDSFFLEYTDLQAFLERLIKTSMNDFDFIIIDNQAGSNLTSKTSSSISNKVIIVSELDPISSDAVDTLLIQIGDFFPEYRRHLINKLEIKETEDYKNLSLLFQSMNRLPPLPFDFEVRSAFASRRIPIDVEKPTTFLIALYNTVKAFLPEYQELVDKYGEKIYSKFTEYQDKVNALLEERANLNEQLENLRRKADERRRRITRFISVVVIELGAITVITSFVFSFEIPSSALLGALFSLGGIIYYFVTSSKTALSPEDMQKKGGIETDLDYINKEIDRYQSLMLTRTKEFLLLFEQ